MLKSPTKLIAIISLMLVFLFSSVTCFANEDKDKEIMAAIVNRNINLISGFDSENIGLVKAMKDAYGVVGLYGVDQTVNDKAWNFYLEFKKELCNLNGDFSMFSKKELSELVLYITSFAIDARDVSGYSILNELLGEENIIQVQNEGIESTCLAYMALTCHNEYLAISGEEQEQLLTTILDYEYSNINEISSALIALSNTKDATVLQQWEKNKMDQIIELYNNQDCSIEEVSKIISCASIYNINVNEDQRFCKGGKFILEDFYERLKMNTNLNKKNTENVLNALNAYEFYCLALKDLSFYNKYVNLKVDDNYIDSEIYNYIVDESDIAKHWSKEKFINLVLNSSIPYDYKTNRDFFPSNAITRGEFISWISKYKNMYKSEKNYFSDINDRKIGKIVNGFTEDCILEPYQTEAEKKNVLDCYFDGRFRPDDLITREEAAFFIKCAYGYIDLPEKETESVRKFSDYNACSSKYKDAIRFCIRYGYISGRGNKIAPKETLTRAEAATMICRNSVNLR